MASTEKTTTQANDTSGAIARGVGQAAGSAHTLIDRASDAARPVVDHLAAGAHQAVDKLAGAASQAAETLDVKGSQFKDQQLRIVERCRVQIRDNPITSLGVAVAAGFVLSWLFRRR